MISNSLSLDMDSKNEVSASDQNSDFGDTPINTQQKKTSQIQFQINFTFYL